MHNADHPASLLRNGSLVVALLLPVALCLAALCIGSRAPQSWFAWLASAQSAPQAHPARVPPIMLWAWERPEDLRFINPDEVGVVFLAKTLFLRGTQVAMRPRLQPLLVPPGTTLVAVVRIESDYFKRPRLSVEQRLHLVASIVEVTRFPGLAAIQVDFDARVSERPFYRSVLQALRHQLPASMRLSITALASWCVYDDWVSALPIDEAVPMLFRMGVDRSQVLRFLEAEAGQDFRSVVCQRSVGLSMDEHRPRLWTERQVYIFSPRAWSVTTAQSVISEVQQW